MQHFKASQSSSWSWECSSSFLYSFSLCLVVNSREFVPRRLGWPAGEGSISPALPSVPLPMLPVPGGGQAVQVNGKYQVSQNREMPSKIRF